MLRFQQQSKLFVAIIATILDECLHIHSLYSNINYKKGSAMIAVLCLALNIYHEARGEPIDGQLLVAETVIQRSIDRDESICEVVYDSNQYSWTHDDLSDIPTDGSAIMLSIMLASQCLRGDHLHSGATHYHTVDVNPYWSEHLVLLGRYGNHIFYVES